MSPRVTENPFYVLEVRPEASAMEVERAGQKLLAMLGVGLAGATDYSTPLGDFQRDDALVRWALDQLRDPVKRARHAGWAQLPPRAAIPVPPETDAAWPELLAQLGWR